MRARCLAFGARALFPEVLSGFYTDVEIQDHQPSDEVDFNLNNENEVIIENLT